MSEQRVRDEDRAKFVKLANKRVSAALKAIQLIGNLSNRSNYDYTEEDVAKIFRALNEEMNGCRKKFEAAQKRQKKTQFSLD